MFSPTLDAIPRLQAARPDLLRRGGPHLLRDVMPDAVARVVALRPAAAPARDDEGPADPGPPELPRAA